MKSHATLAFALNASNYFKMCFIYFKGSDKEGGVSELNMKNVGGVFAVLAAGCGVAIGLGILRWIFNVRDMAKKLEVNYRRPSSYLK